MEIATQREQDELSIELDLTCLGDCSQALPIRISLHADAVTQLIDNAFRGDRVYEFFHTPHGDIKRHLWIRIIEVTERIRDRYAREDTDCPGNECPYPEWDSALLLTWDEQPEECAWHQVKQPPLFKQFIDYWFNLVVQSQSLLRQSEDILIQNEI